MPSATRLDADSIRILVATDNHVGYQETHPVRGDDSWKTFHEIMCLAKEKDVDMVMLGGDLFDKHTPSRKSMVNVIRSLRMNCLGDKPCELEFLSDGSEIFGGTFNHVNYEDQDINVAIPVFSIHGNHDEPTGHEFYCALDVLQETGLINYFGRVPKNNAIEVRPVLLQKGRTKVAMYGLSNVRDERLFREFRDGRVKFFQPSVHKDEWFNLGVVHQNHHARTPTGYLPEHFLPDFLDLIFWGHEHDCILEPSKNADQGFHVIQPGSSVATQMTAGEAIEKHVGVLTVQGKSFTWDPIRLKTIRPLIFRDITLANVPAMKSIVKRNNNRAEISRFLKKTITDMITEANDKWLQQQGGDLQSMDEEDSAPPQPLLRLRVDYTAPDGGSFDMENPQRIANEFIGKVANHEDILLYHIKKATNRSTRETIDMPDAAVMEQIGLEGSKVEDLVAEFLVAQTLTILPQNSFGDSVNQFIARDDKHAMDHFVKQSLESQIKTLFSNVDEEQVDLTAAMEDHRLELEKLFSAGHRTQSTKRVMNPKPDEWDSELDGPWENDPEAYKLVAGDDDASIVTSTRNRVTPANANLRNGAKAASTISTAARRRPASAAKASARSSRAKANTGFVADDDDEDSDVQMEQNDGDDADEGDENLFVAPAQATRRRAASSTSKASTTTKPSKSAPSRTTATLKTTTSNGKASVGSNSTRQTQLDVSASQSNSRRTAPARAAASKKVIEISDDEISDEDAFEPVTASRATRRR